jgi:glycosyltransferase involved in cell wall biosynthesis
MKAQTLTISVVVPVYNGESTIARCLESILAQSYPQEAFEVIVVENGSNDRTTEIASGYPVRLFHNQVRGPAAARQFGLTQSAADIVVFTDADCYADPNWLCELVKPYADDAVGGVGGAVLAYSHAQRNLVEQFADKNTPLANFTGGAGEFMPRLHTCNASYRRALLMQIGGFDTRLVTADDTDISWRLQLKTGCRLAYAEKAVIYHHHRATTRGLAKQYRQYGYAEILLDTMYRHEAGYPRSRSWQIKRILGQVSVLPRYAASSVLNRIRLARGHATIFQAASPKLWLLAESSNLRGKLEGLWATRFMSDAAPALKSDPGQLVDRYFQNRKE